MMVVNIDGVKLVFPDEMGQKEAEGYLRGQLCLNRHMRLACLEIEVDGSEAVLYPHYDTVKRVRRVTGYLSELVNFTAAKRDEESVRERHL